MTEENTKKVTGNPVIPNPPIPSQVRMSAVPKPPEPIVKEAGGVEVEAVGDEKGLTSLEDVLPPDILKEEMDARPKGVIVIKVFENSPYEVEFSGVITGSEIDIAWKAMMKEYRVWKHTLFKKQEAEVNGGV